MFVYKYDECDEYKEPEHIFIENKNSKKEQDLFIRCTFPLYHALLSEEIKEAIQEMAPPKKTNNKLLQKLKSILHKRKKTQSIEEFYKEKINFIINHFDPVKLFYKICINNYHNIYLFDDLIAAQEFCSKAIVPKIKDYEEKNLVQAFEKCAEKADNFPHYNSKRNKSCIIFCVKTSPNFLIHWLESTALRHMEMKRFAEKTKKVQKQICGFMFYREKTFGQCYDGKYKYNSTVVIIGGQICIPKNISTWKTFRNNQKLIAHLKRLLCLSSLFIINRSKDSPLKRLPYDCMIYIFCYLGGDVNRYPKENQALINFFCNQENATQIEKQLNLKKFKYPTFFVSNEKIELTDAKSLDPGFCDKLFALI